MSQTLWSDSNYYFSLESESVSECFLDSRRTQSKKVEFTKVNEHFFDQANDEVGLSGQTLLESVSEVDPESCIHIYNFAVGIVGVV